MQIRHDITSDLVFVDGGHKDGVRIAHSISQRRGGYNNEIVCIADGSHITRTGGGRVGGATAWPADNVTIREMRLRGVCIPGNKAPFDADGDVCSLLTTPRMWHCCN